MGKRSEDRTAEERISLIEEALNSLKSGELELYSFALVVKHIVKPEPMTEEGRAWAINALMRDQTNGERITSS